ncbi:hypothetical protein CAC42_5529 [Sphaceloma murrayae]|uniref:Erythromycin esterase n=1 Tax=Sphaceloma murrayae TaxID=2082308 RepID=A0A2K1QYI6_9PEZI|nr:hypothetical protein CAC42_5529 [Sphaceloma murrayae]
MARRASARIRARKSTTPQPSKTTDLYQDGHLRTPKTAPQLASVAESSDEMPGAFPVDDTPNKDTPTKLARHISDAVAGKTTTPRNRAPRPSEQEMYPDKFHQSTTKPMDEARWLGISAIVPHTEPPKGVEKWTPAADTPTKNIKHADKPNSGSFEFTFRAQSLELSNEARQMMAEKREEAARLKRDMARIEEEKHEEQEISNRKKATAKGRVGRFSDVHMAQFKKMDSIANHASASRPNSRDQNADFRPGSRDRPVSRDNIGGPAEATKGKIQYPSLKRSGSKAGLKQGGRDTEESTPARIPTQQEARGLPTPEKNRKHPPEDGGSPAKRVKLDVRDTGLPVPAQSVVKIATPSVMQRSVQGSPGKSSGVSYPNLSTPTKSSMARAATVKANKTSMIPSLTRTPSKSASKIPASKSHAGSSLLARSPTKFAHMSAKKPAPRVEPGSPLLARSPTKGLFAERMEVNAESDSGGDKTRLLLRSPARPPRDADGCISGSDQEASTQIPLLSRTPARPTSESNPFANLPTSTGPKSNLMDRFKLLRKSPIKSILRTPQRLYSDDPNKIAAGTHLATPPSIKPLIPFGPSESQRQVNFNPPATEPVVKHVDFSASTKSDEDSPMPSRSVIEPSGYPSLQSYPPLPTTASKSAAAKRRQTLGPLTAKDFTFRADAGASITFGPSPGAKKHSPKMSIRHVSAEPALGGGLGVLERKRKFEEEDDVFAPVASPSRPRGRNAETDVAMSGIGSDKENDGDEDQGSAMGKGRERAASVEVERPSKRVRVESVKVGVKQGTDEGVDKVPSWAKGTAAQQARASLAKREGEKKKGTGVLKGKGVKPAFAQRKAVGKAAGVSEKGRDDSPSVVGEDEKRKEGDKAVLSRARLAALSQPKRRVGA